MKLFITYFIVIFCYCSNIVFSQNLTFHLFQFENKIGIVNSKGEVTLEPKYDCREYYIKSFNNTNYSKYMLIYNNETHKSGLIDYKGKEYFKDIDKIRYDANGQFAGYFDDDSNSMGLHILSIPEEKELIHFTEKASVEFHGKSEYFFSVVHNGKWKIYNNIGKKIYELGARKEIFVIEENYKFLALALSTHRGIYVEYIDKDGQVINDNKIGTLRNKFLKLLSEREKSYEINYDYSSDCNIENAMISTKDYSKIDCKKYNSGNIRYLCTKDGKQGVLNNIGAIILEPKYDKIEIMSKYFKIFVGDKVGLSDIDGKIIYPPIFNHIRYEPILNDIESDPSIENKIDLTYKNYLFEATFEGTIFAPKDVKFE